MSHLLSPDLGDVVVAFCWRLAGIPISFIRRTLPVLGWTVMGRDDCGLGWDGSTVADKVIKFTD